MLFNTDDRTIYERQVEMTFDGIIWIPITTVKETLNGYRRSTDGKWTKKKLCKVFETMNIIPTKFNNSSKLYITYIEANTVEKSYLKFITEGTNSEIFDIRL